MLVNPLTSLLYSHDSLIKWRTISIFSDLISSMANECMEDARVVMRRLMWTLNDESGGIGWGAPEVMGAAAAKSKRIFDEYSHIIISYVNPKGNFLEHQALQSGSLWAFGQLTHCRPKYMEKDVDLLAPFLVSEYSETRGMAIWALTPINIINNLLIRNLKISLNDPTRISIYVNGSLKNVSIKALTKHILVSRKNI